MTRDDPRKERYMMKVKSTLLALVGLSLAFLSMPASAAITSLGSCAQSAVQTAITAANSGDTIALPACSSTTWSTPVTLSKAVTLQGQTSCTGGGGTAGSTVSCTNNTTINFSSSGELIINASNARVTGITFRGAGNGNNASMVEINEGFTGWRFDHNDIQPSSQSYRCVYVYGGSGLIDHNHITSCNDGVAIDGGTPGDANTGDYRWSHPLTLRGNSDAVFMEDNFFDDPASEGDGAYDIYNGAVVVFRHNYVNGTNVGGHGLDSGGVGTRSALMEEVYSNTFINPRSSNVYQVVDSRGGTWMVYNNTVSPTNGSYGLFLWLHLYRSDDGYGFGNGASCSSNTNWIDGNSNGHGYPCRDQLGRGPESAPANDWPVKTTLSVYSEVLMPGYSWLNTFQGSRITGVLDPYIRVTNGANADPPTNASQYQILNNRDFYQDVGSAGNGTSGVGVGTLAQRPATCTHSTTPDGQGTGVGYWATDTSILYVCTATNTWSTYYQPYTYPHPLQSGGTPPQSPTNLSVTVH